MPSTSPGFGGGGSLASRGAADRPAVERTNLPGFGRCEPERAEGARVRRSPSDADDFVDKVAESAPRDRPRLARVPVLHLRHHGQAQGGDGAPRLAHALHPVAGGALRAGARRPLQPAFRPGARPAAPRRVHAAAAGRRRRRAGPGRGGHARLPGAVDARRRHHHRAPDARHGPAAGGHPRRPAGFFRCRRFRRGRIAPLSARNEREGAGGRGRRREGPTSVDSLRRAFFVGDVLTRTDVGRMHRLAPNLQVINYYGSTETQRAVAHFVVPARPVAAGEGDDPGRHRHPGRAGAHPQRGGRARRRGRGGRDLDAQPARGPRLPGRPGADRRALRPQPVDRRRRRSRVPHRRPGPLPPGRRGRDRRPRGPAGEDPRLPHRAGGDRGRPARAPRRPRHRRRRPRRGRRQAARGVRRRGRRAGARRAARRGCGPACRSTWSRPRGCSSPRSR